MTIALVTTLQAVPDEGQLSSERRRSLPAGVLTLTAIKLTFGPSAGSGQSGGYTSRS